MNVIGLGRIVKAAVPPAMRPAIRLGLQIGKALPREARRAVFRRELRFQNRERISNFDFTLSDRHRPSGVSAMVRVKNEEAKLSYTLGSIVDVFDEIVVVDNASGDQTLEVALALKSQRDRQDKIRLYSYPFRVGRVGQEHLATPEDSVHSLTYYYNWCLSLCSYRYVCKWDGDMVLRRGAKPAVARLFRMVQWDDVLWVLPGQQVYRDPAHRYYLAKGEIFQEPALFPNGINPRFYKADQFEDLVAQPLLPVKTFVGPAFYELQFTDQDEFAHWTTPAFPPRSKKQRQWDSFHMIKQGKADEGRFDLLPADFLDAEVDSAPAGPGMRQP